MHNLESTGGSLVSGWYETITSWRDRLLNDRAYSDHDFAGKWELQKLLLAEKERAEEPYYQLRERVNAGPSWTYAFQDNLLRFTGLAFLERLMVVRQSSLFSSQLAFTSKNNTTACLDAMRRQGFFTGALRGNLLSYLQFAGVQLQAYALSHGDPTTFMASLLALDTLLYPLDTVKVRYQADVSGKFRGFLDCLNKTRPAELYSGLPMRLIFSALYGFHLTRGPALNLAEGAQSLGLLALAYPFLTLKTIGQVTLNSSNPVSNVIGSVTLTENLFKMEGLKVVYRGFLPFALLSFIAPHYLPAIWSKGRQQAALEDADPQYTTKHSNRSSYQENTI